MRQNAPLAAVVNAVHDAGVESLLWSPNVTGSTPETNASFVWPTLGDLVERDGRRLLLFSSRPRNDTLNAVGGATGVAAVPPWLLHQWDFFFANGDRNPVQGDSPAACAVARGGPADLQDTSSVAAAAASARPVPGAARGKLAQLNHFDAVPAPSSTTASAINPEVVLRAHADECAVQWGGKRANVVAVDFWSVGNPLRTVAEMNGEG